MTEADFVRYRAKNLDGRDLAWAKKQFKKLDAEGVTENGDPGVELILSDTSSYGHRGVVVSANRQIDVTTGTIQIQALFPNSDGLLRPGQYGRVRIRRQDAGTAVLTVPEKALISVQGTYSVGIVGPGNKVALKRVELGPSGGGVRVVTSGVNEGDRVVVEGVQKISDGAVVNPQPAPTPVASAAPLEPASSAAAKN
jgi:RND family efflux transporter MFP subunit